MQAHGFCQDRDGNFWAGDSGPFADNPATKGRGFQMFKFSPDGKVLLTLGKAGVSKAGHATRSSARRPARSRPTATSSSPMATGRGPPTRSRTAIGSCGSRPTASSCREYGKHGHRRPASSWGRTRWRSIRRGVCSSPIARTTASRCSIATMKFVDEWRHFGRPERRGDPEGRHADRRRLRIEPSDRRSAAGA